MNITETRQGPVLVCALRGRLDAVAAPEVSRWLDAAAQSPGPLVVLDLSGVEYLSSAGLRALLSAAKRVQQSQGRLALAAPAAQAGQTLEMAGFGDIIPIHGSVAAACRDLSPEAAAPSKPAPVNFAEELYLLALNDAEGELKPVTLSALEYALAGALLMELALLGRIDTDTQALAVISGESTGDPLLDDALATLRAESTPQNVTYWLRKFAQPSMNVKERAVAGLVNKGILRQEKRKLLWVFSVRRYPMVDQREAKEVRTRLRDLILGNDIPDPRDAVLISLGNACRVLDDMFTSDERRRVKNRIESLARLDLIGREMTDCVREIENTIAVMVPPSP